MAQHLCIVIASRGSSKGREICAEVTLQLRQCYRNHITWENLLWKSGSISFQNRNSQSENLFGYWRPTKPFMGSLQRAFSCGCLWWNQQIISLAVSSTLLGTVVPYNLNWPASLELSVSRCQSAMSCIIYNGPGYNSTHFWEIKNFLSTSPRLTCLPEHPLKGIFRNPGIEDWAEQVHTKAERKAQTEHCHVTKCLCWATRIKKFWLTCLKKIK